MTTPIHFVIFMQHNPQSEGSFKVTHSYKDAADVTHANFESYGYVLRGERAYDTDRDDEDVTVAIQLRLFAFDPGEYRVVSFGDGCDGPQARIERTGDAFMEFAAKDNA